MKIKKLEENNKQNIQVTGQQMYIVIDKLSYACSIAEINFKGEVRSNLYKYGDKYVIFMCCRDFFLDPIQRAKIAEFGHIINRKPGKVDMLIHDDALEKLSLMAG